jgi:sugar lactone lactonase YvrE
MQFRVLAGLGCRVGESPVWDDRRRALFLCDILAPSIHLVAMDGGTLETWRFDRPVGSLGLTASGRLIVALGRDLAILDPDSGALSALAQVPEPETSRLNDGKVGPDGRFYVGSMDDRPEKEPVGSLYRVSASGLVERVDAGFKISNGLAWSPDGRRLYHSDSRGPWIDVLDFDPAAGTVGPRHRFAELDDTTGRPDGGACDAEGAYWSAGVSTGVLNRFDPDGTLSARIPLPVRAPTMPCFCGPDLRLLAVTSLSEGLPAGDGPDGHVIVARAEVAGTPIGRMAGL